MPGPSLVAPGDDLTRPPPRLADERSPVVIIGAGHAGVQVAASLREEGYAGAVKLLSAETHLPYQRPPLSKAFLKGAMEADGLPLRAAQFYPDKGVELLLGEEATRIDRHSRRVELASGRRLDYGHLVLATGARQRPLDVPGIDLNGVLVLRDLTDARILRERLGAARRIVVIGAGFIGLEIAATATSLGGAVTVVEVSPRPLGRAVSPATSAVFLEAHQAFGAKFLLRRRRRRFAWAGRRGERRRIVEWRAVAGRSGDHRHRRIA